MDASQLKNYTKMTTARSYATAVGYQGMLIITGVGMISTINYLLLKYLIVRTENGTLVVIYPKHTTGYNQ